uniref:Putative magnesium transporter NIPA8 n=1 Tax=Oliveria decumbens TaxID=2571315 RepID=A0A5J6NI61_9APIA|nr:putative magnesium transporter NIPA8 [Oliveria decumbens]
MKMKASGFLKKILSIVSKAKSIADLKNRMRKIKTRFMIYSLLSTDKKVLFGSISHKLQALIQDQNEAASAAANQESNLSLQLAPVLCDDNMNATMLPPNVTRIEAHDEDDEKVADTSSHEEGEEEVVLDQNTTEETEEVEDMNDFVISGHENEIIQENEEADDNDMTKDIYPDLRHSLFDEDEYEMGRPGSVIELVKKTKEAQDGEEFKLEDQIDEVADLFIQRFHRQMWIQKQNSFKRRSSTTNSTSNL